LKLRNFDLVSSLLLLFLLQNEKSGETQGKSGSEVLRRGQLLTEPVSIWTGHFLANKSRQ
jgi:hypothetical protein